MKELYGPVEFWLALGSGAKKISLQLKEQGFKFDARSAKYWQELADATSSLYLGGMIPRRQMDSLRKKLVGRISKHLQLTKNKRAQLTKKKPCAS